jgi:hypothetical protein
MPAGDVSGPVPCSRQKLVRFVRGPVYVPDRYILIHWSNYCTSVESSKRTLDVGILKMPRKERGVKELNQNAKYQRKNMRMGI